MENTKYSLGLDIGIGSVGWCAINQEKGELIDFGVRLFETAKEAKDQRQARSTRRNIRRKRWRKQQLINAFDEFSIIPKEEMMQTNYLLYTANEKGFKRPKEDTVYHLRQKATKEKVSKRELLLCLYDMLQARGHFLLETIDFDKNGITLDLFKEKLFYLLDILNIEINEDKNEFEKIIEKTYNSRILKNEIKKLFRDYRYTNDEDEQKLVELISLLNGYKSNLYKLIDSKQTESIGIDELKKKENLSDFDEAVIELFDISNIAKILSSGCNYICDAAVINLDKFKNASANRNKNEKEYEEIVQELKKVNNSKNNKHLRSVRNLANNYPNGLYVKEAKAILHKQQEFYKEITNPFIEVCISILSAKIPYYIGPLNENAKNAWIKKKGNFKYSYEYSREKAVDEYESIRIWKKNMISHCTYLPDEEALPKGSIIGETFSIINELNNYSAIDKDNNDYYLSNKDKVKVFDNLFLVKRKVTLKEIAEILELKEYRSVSGRTINFNNSYSLYFDIVKIIPELKINSIVEIFDENNEKLNKLEQIILDINLFNEEKSKFDYFKTSKLHEYDDTVARRLSKLKSNSFYSLSNKIIMKQPLNINGESMMMLLFDDNDSKQKNNQMTILRSATDKNGAKVDFASNKYVRKIESNCELNIDLLIKNGKPTMPISRPVIRALNETLKVYKTIEELYGTPERLIVETARGEDAIKDFTEQSQVSEKHFKKIQNTYDYIKKKINENYNDSVMQGKLEEWKDIEYFYEKNKTKVELYIRQDGIDLLTGEKIIISNFNNYEIDHILPRGFGDDSMDDKMLTIRLANAKKGDRLPIEFLESSDKNGVSQLTVGEYERIVKNLFEIKAISENKLRRLMLRNQDEAETFINQNLVDTRYIIKEFMSMINAYNFVKKNKTHIVALKAVFTNLYRKVLGFEKDRELGNQHHAYDAAIVCIADKVLSQYYPNYDNRGNYTKYREFISRLKPTANKEVNNENRKQLELVVEYAFKDAYGQSINKSNLLNELKSTVPLVSYKTEKNWKGKYFDENPLKPEREDSNSPLYILGINNSKRKFSGVNCVCVDFYKVKGEHIAIHVPYLLVDDNGNINKEQYIKLVKKFYKANDLINEKGEINTYYFRLRMFKNDLFYDTHTRELYVFSMGSIVNKKLEIKNINIYSHNMIYSKSKELRDSLYKRFDVKTRTNENGTEFSDISKKDLYDYLYKGGYIKNIDTRYMNAFIKETERCKTYREYISLSHYLDLEAERTYAPPSIIGQNCPVVNNNTIKKDKNAQYLKLKSSVLGIRFKKNEINRLIIEGPRYYKNKYSIISHDTFSWKISKYSV